MKYQVRQAALLLRPVDRRTFGSHPANECAPHSQPWWQKPRLRCQADHDEVDRARVNVQRELARRVMLQHQLGAVLGQHPGASVRWL